MNKYAAYDPDQLEEHFSNYLIDSWSYSKVVSFSRNEKNFEKEEIYREKSKRSATTVAGSAYHKALELFFDNLSHGVETSLVELETEAFSYIDNIPANEWKLQKTAPDIESCRKKANDTVVALIRNFEGEKGAYLDDLEEVLGVEIRCSEWLNVNGVDVPLPCHAVIDLPIRTKGKKVVVIDHKAKTAFADEKSMKFTCSKQAIVYAKIYEAKTGIRVDEVWFMENKSTANKDKSPQIRQFKVILDDDTRKLYEAALYEPLRRMIEAVSNPDYVYLVNDSDNLVDQGEIYDFWMRSMIAEVTDFNIPTEKKGLISKRQKKIRDASLAAISPKTITAFKQNAAAFITYDISNSDMSNSEKIEHVLRTFNVLVQVAHEIEGYSSNTYLLEVSAGVKISNVMRYKLDIASALNVASIRIGEKLTVYMGKSYLFIESPKKRTKDLLFDAKYLKGRKIPIGVDNFGNTVIWDMDGHSTPHMLICGATGSGKSVSILSTIEYAKLAGVTDIVIFDPKYEFCRFAGEGVRVYNEIEDIEDQMGLLVEQMQGRAKSGAAKHETTLVIFDEFADAVSAARSGKELDIREPVQVGYKITMTEDGVVEEPKFDIKTTGRHKSLEEKMKILLQKGRSLGYRIIAATQRASVKVITGDAKVNFPVLICFRVPKEVDSKVVLDEPGAETLAGMGDGLIKSPEYMDVIRFQGFYKK